MTDKKNLKRKRVTPREMISQNSNDREKKYQISYVDMKRMIEEVEARFISPSPQDDLGGILGITLRDIASSLGVPHKDLKRKLEKPGDLEFIRSRNYLIRKVFLIPAAGARTHTYVMDVRAAQYVVSGYNNFQDPLFNLENEESILID